MTATVSANPHPELRIQILDHTTLPVRDQFAAARFYTVIFNGEIDHVGRSFLRAAPEGMAQGVSSSPHQGMGVKICEGLVVGLFEQDFGQPTAEQGHPHHALEIPPDVIPAWIEHLNYWDVPYDGPHPREQDRSCSIYFFDIDGNHLELHATNLPDEVFRQIPPAPHDHTRQVRATPWPPSHLEGEANRMLAEKLEGWRRGGAH